MAKAFFDEMFVGLANALLQDPEDEYYKKMLMHEYFKKYQGIEDRDVFDKEIESARLTNKKKYDLIIMFFGLMLEATREATKTQNKEL